MQESTVAVGSFIQVYIRENGGQYHVDTQHWDEIDAALHQYIERGIDRVLSLTSTCQKEILIPVSRVSDASTSTPESRQRNREIMAALKAEDPFSED